MWAPKLILFVSLLRCSMGEPIPVALPALIGPRCANHSDTPYLYPLNDGTGGPTATPTGSGVFPTSPIGTGSRTAGSNTTVGPKGPPGSGFPSGSYVYSIANLTTPTAWTISGRTGFITGSSSGVFPLPTSNTSVGGTGGLPSGSTLPVSSPFILNFTGTPLTWTATRPTIPTLIISTTGTGVGHQGTGVGPQGTGVGHQGTGTGESASATFPGPFGNSSSAGSFPTGSVTAGSSDDIYGYYLPPISSETGVASASSVVASSNSSFAHVASTVSDSFTLTTVINPSLFLSSGSLSGPSGSNITSPTGVGNSSLSSTSPSDGPSTYSPPLVPYYPIVPLTSGTIASGTSPVSSGGTGVPNTSSTGPGGPFNTSSASVTDGSIPPTSDPTVVPSFSDPTSLLVTPTSPALDPGSSEFGPVGGTSTLSSGTGGSSSTTFGTSIKSTGTNITSTGTGIKSTGTSITSTGTISQNVVPTEYSHHRRPHGYGSADSYGYDYDYDFDFEDDYAYE